MAVKKRLMIVMTVSILCSVLLCKRQDVLSRIRSGDFSNVHKGTYRGRLRFLRESSTYHESTKKLRQDIDENEDILILISQRFYTIPHKQYRYKFTALDEESNYLVLRYFARIGEHPLYAGYQIQFVFNPQSQTVTEVYTAEVALE
jgi:hypothetical protein